MEDIREIVGKIHSIESFSTIDGPSIRSVVFMSGCFLRCPFCHNIDVVLNPENQTYKPRQLLDYLTKFSDYWGDDGGITLSGGDPLVQIDFTQEITKLTIQSGYNMTLDTALICNESRFVELLDNLYTPGGISSISDSDSSDESITCDVGKGGNNFRSGISEKLFWMTSFKPQVFAKITPGYNYDNFMKNLKMLISKLKLLDKALLRVRYVVIRGFTDNLEASKELVNFVSQIGIPIELELLPYVSWGEKKWLEQGLEYALKGLSSTTHPELMNFREIVANEINNSRLDNIAALMPLAAKK